MTRTNLLLLLGVLFSALYLVNVQYQGRQLFSERDRAQTQARHLAAEHERLEVEKRALSSSTRIEQLARTKLQMHAASPAITSYVAYPAQSASAPARAVKP